MLYICGSFRFVDEMEHLENILKNDKIDYLISKRAGARGIVGCLEKIDKADIVYVVNPEGYVGRSVCVDIGYAYARNRPIYAMHSIEDPPLMKMVADILSFEELTKLLRQNQPIERM
jgi:nucleoside 2-deoxyribosyltransferase